MSSLSELAIIGQLDNSRLKPPVIGLIHISQLGLAAIGL